MDKTKELFKRKLKGEPIGQDSFGRDVLEGDILLFAATVSQSAEMRVIKVIETVADKGAWAKPGAVKFRIRRARRGWGEDVHWTLQKRASFITKLENTYLLDNPPQELIDIFEEEEEAK